MDGSQSIADLVEEFFHEDGLKYQEMDNGVYRSGFEGREASYRAFFIAENSRQILRIVIMVETNFAVQYRSLISEYLTRANYGLRIGNFEMDFNDGCVQFRVAADFEDGVLNTKIIRRMLVCAVGTMDRYYPGLMETIWGGKSAKEAVNNIEHPILQDAEEDV